MKIIENTITIPHFNYEVFNTYFDGHKFATFDIETTGLNPKTASIILVGFAMPISDDKLWIKQIFADNLNDERKLILETLKTMTELDFVVTFNGSAFDMNFLNKRMFAQDIRPACDIYNLDILKLIRSHSSLKNLLPNLKQKTVERYLGITNERDDKIDGRESIRLYFEYLKTKNDGTMRTILLHNYDDIIQLYKLLDVLKVTDFHRAMSKLGFVSNGYTIKEAKLSYTKLVLSGTCDDISKRYKAYDDERGYEINLFKGNFTITINLIHRKELTFIDIGPFDDAFIYFKNTGQIVDDFLILSHQKQPNHFAVNMLSKYMLQYLMP